MTEYTQQTNGFHFYGYYPQSKTCSSYNNIREYYYDMNRDEWVNLDEEHIKTNQQNLSKYQEEDLLPAESDLDNADYLENYLDSLSARNLRKYDKITANIREELNKVCDSNLFFKEIDKGKHPLAVRHLTNIMNVLSNLHKNKLISDEVFINLSFVIKNNFDKVFDRLSLENYNLLRLANISKAKSLALTETLEYYADNVSGEEFYNLLIDATNNVSEKIDEVEVVHKRLENKYFGKNRALTNKEREAIRTGLQRLFESDNKHKEKQEKLKTNFPLIPDKEKEGLNKEMLENERDVRAELNYEREKEYFTALEKQANKWRGI